jgi:hypothetical protein
MRTNATKKTKERKETVKAEGKDLKEGREGDPLESDLGEVNGEYVLSGIDLRIKPTNKRNGDGNGDGDPRGGPPRRRSKTRQRKKTPGIDPHDAETIFNVKQLTEFGPSTDCHYW